MWMLVLLVWTLLLVLFSVGYQVAKPAAGDDTAALTSEELASACADAFNDRLNTTDDEDETQTCPEVKTTSAFDVSYFQGPSFLYPFGWQAVAYDRALDSTLWHFIRVSPEPLWLCDGCDGPTSPVTIVVRENTTNVTLETIIDGQYTEGNGYSELQKGMITVNGTEVMHITGKQEGMSSAAFEDYVLVTPATVVRVYYDAAWEQDNAAVADAWAIIRASLDFSHIE